MNAQKIMEAFFRTNTRHPEDAYKFLYETLDWIQGQIVRDEKRTRHISGKELSLGFRDLAIEQFGCMARTVLETWNIRSTENIGDMVFDLVGIGLMGTSGDDQKSDFDGIFDFKEELAVRPVIEGYVPGKKEWVIKYKKINTFPERN